MNNVGLNNFECQKPAIGKFYWKDHKYKNKAEGNKITLRQILRVELTKEKTLNFQIETTSGLNSPLKYVSDKFNEGPFIDTLCYTLKPLNKDAVACTKNSSGATPIKNYSLQSISNSGVNPGLSMMRREWLRSNFSINNSTSQILCKEVSEFEPKKFIDGNKDIIIFNMNPCGKNSSIYNGDDLSSLRYSNAGARIGVGFIPFYGIVGGFLTPSDTVYSVPECAKSTLQGKWNLEFSPLKNSQEMEFELNTEARTVFASNDYGVEKVAHAGDCLNWIKTVHKIKQIFRVVVDQNQEGVHIDLISREIKTFCSRGYEAKVKCLAQIDENSEIFLTEEEVWNLLHIQL